MSEAVEGIGSKVSRTIQEIKDRPAILLEDRELAVRAARKIWQQVMSVREREGWITDPLIRENYLGNSGLTLASYAFEIPSPFVPYFERFKAKSAISVPVHVFEFPVDSRLDIYVTPSAEIENTNKSIKRVKGAIASITGPTFLPSLGGPNNGWYYKDDPSAHIPFQETNPPGDRRGAFAFDDDGNLHLLDDAQKWEIVAADFNGFRSVVGTSNFFREEDLFASLQEPVYDGRGNLSYLMQYKDKKGQLRFGFSVSTGRISRPTMYAILNDFIRLQGASDVFGVELEQGGASCIVVGPDGYGKYGGEGFIRRDHYVISKI